MKKILIFLISTIICCACESEKQQVVESEIYFTNVGSFKYVEFDGHEYLIWRRGDSQGGITHSPKCPCQFK